MEVLYGVPGNMTNVTKKFLSHAQGEKVILSLYNLVLGDPNPFQEKILQINRPHLPTLTFEENTPFLYNLRENREEELHPLHSLSIYAMFKNEAHILEEWLNHYLQEGVEHFYLIDNGSTDNFQKILDKYKDKITLYSDATRYAQKDLYFKYLFPHNWESTWIMIVDLDEFVYSRKEFKRISDYLSTLPEDVSRVDLFWKMFGSNGHINQPPSVIQGFTRRHPMVAWNVGCFRTYPKSIFRGKKVKELFLHTSRVEGKAIFPNGKDSSVVSGDNLTGEKEQNIFYRDGEEHPLHLNHYPIQSYEWFRTVKSPRGDAVCAHLDRVRDENYFRIYDLNEVDDKELASKIY